MRVTLLFLAALVPLAHAESLARPLSVSTLEVPASPASLVLFDGQGRPAVGVKVTLTDAAGARLGEWVTDGSGHAVLTGVPAGRYGWSVLGAEGAFYLGDVDLERLGADVQDQIERSRARPCVEPPRCSLNSMRQLRREMDAIRVGFEGCAAPSAELVGMHQSLLELVEPVLRENDIASAPDFLTFTAELRARIDAECRRPTP